MLLKQPDDGSQMHISIRRRAIAAVAALVALVAALFAFATSHATTSASGAGLKPAQTGAGETRSERPRCTRR